MDDWFILTIFFLIIVDHLLLSRRVAKIVSLIREFEYQVERRKQVATLKWSKGRVVKEDEEETPVG